MSEQLNVNPLPPQQARRSLPVCLECGGPLGSVGARRGNFCCARHRLTWNNRRMTRGAEIYDLFMVLRYDRETGKLLKLWRIINRMAARFREEDRRERDGRRSWRKPRDVLADKPYLNADVLSRHVWSRSSSRVRS